MKVRDQRLLKIHLVQVSYLLLSEGGVAKWNLSVVGGGV